MPFTHYTFVFAVITLSLFSSCLTKNDAEPAVNQNNVFNLGLEIRTYPFGYVSDTARLLSEDGRIFGYLHTVLLTTDDVGADLELSGMTQAIALRIRTSTPEFPSFIRADLASPSLGAPRFVCEIHEDLDLDLLSTRQSRILEGGFVRMTTNSEGEVRIIVNGGSGTLKTKGIWEGRLQPAVSEF